MRVPDEFLTCVCFLCVRTDHGFKLAGTGFFVLRPSEVHANYGYVYLVTAKHCVVEAEKHGGLFLRLNTLDGKSQMIHVDTPWYFPDDPSEDVAVIPFRPDREVFDYKTVPVEMFALDNVVADKSIGVGDDLVIVGLFTRRFGNDRNRPIVRSGVIAAMPDEPIKDSKTGLDYKAYLAEVRSIGGLSGSPVFAALGPVRSGIISTGIQYVLLGVVRGHWDEQSADAIGAGATVATAVNMGLAVVTPVQAVISAINQPNLVKGRKSNDDAHTREIAPVDDSRN